MRERTDQEHRDALEALFWLSADEELNKAKPARKKSDIAERLSQDVKQNPERVLRSVLSAMQWLKVDLLIVSPALRQAKESGYIEGGRDKIVTAAMQVLAAQSARMKNAAGSRYEPTQQSNWLNVYYLTIKAFFSAILDFFKS